MTSPAPRKDQDDAANSWAQVGMALSIPMLLASGPLVGYGLGWLICRWTGWGAWVEILMIALGMVAGIREVIKVIRKIS